MFDSQAEYQSWEPLVRDMIRFSEFALDFSAGFDRFGFTSSQPCYFAAIWCITVIGEAASNLPRSFTNSHPEIPWSQMVGTRHRLIHGYHTIDNDVVWEIITIHLPTLIPQLRAMLDTGAEHSQSLD